jgi:membrane peptidoglycan carboxypeptidase
LEEALIVWLVENNRIAPKERMYEIYLNIIEWGPGIYGAKEASNFYFGKDPSKLTPEESIYMSSIIPRPKKFMWFFDADNNLKPFLEGHYRLVGKRMFDHQFVTEKQFNEMKPNVKITGRAKDYLAKKSGEQPVNIEEDIDDDDSWGFFKKTNSFFKGLMKKDKEKEDSSNEKK